MMSDVDPAEAGRTARIRDLNDMLRTMFIGGDVFITAGVRARGDEFVAACIEAMQSFSDFTEENDPYGEHEFGVVTIEDTDVFWKVDCYDRDLAFGSEDPSDPAKTSRVLTILLADEY